MWDNKSLVLIILIGLLCNSVFSLQDSDENENDSAQALPPRNPQIERQILDKILRDYDKRIRPTGVNNSDEVEVRVNMYIRNIHGLDEENEELSLQIIFRQEWQDTRLAFEELKTSLPSYMLLTDLEEIWIPDVFFSNEKQSHEHHILKPNHYMRIFPDGRILYSARLSMDLDCQIDPTDYPFDTQTCFIKIASYGFTKDQLEFKWKNERPIQISDRLNLDDFEIGEFITSTCDSSTTTGSYSCLRVDFNFERSLETLMAEMYVPSIAIVLFSWTSFWLLPTAATARCSIGILAIIAVAQTVDLKFSFSSAFHCWGTSCILFVIAAFLEFCTANFISQHETTAANPENQDEKRGPWFCPYPKKNSQRIDFWARIIFPLAFILYNIVYWLLNM